LFLPFNIPPTFFQRLIIGFKELLSEGGIMMHATCFFFFLQTFYTSANLSLGDRNPRPIPFTQSLSKGATNGIIGTNVFRMPKLTCCRSHLQMTSSASMCGWWPACIENMEKRSACML
jgi:hypothetical protein